MNSFGYLRFFVLLVFFLFTEACNPSTRQETLSFFFDGVPGIQQKNEQKADTLQNRNPEPQGKERLAEDENNRIQVSTHPDYKNKTCEKCHNIEHSYRLNDRQPELCYQCDKPFNSQFEKLHGPVAAGFCGACHEPHKSEHKALLKMSIRQVCQYCHEPGDVNKNLAHSNNSTVECLTCHNSHGGTSVNLLRSDYQENEE
jgi:predicted CXXCH cytochrome family protein